MRYGFVIFISSRLFASFLHYSLCGLSFCSVFALCWATYVCCAVLCCARTRVGDCVVQINCMLFDGRWKNG